METNILLLSILGLTFATVLSQLFIILIGSSKKSSKEDLGLDSESLAQYRDKYQEILADTARKANKILTNAELKGIEFIAHQKFDTQKIAAQFEQELKALQEKLLSQFKESMEQTLTAYQQYLTTLEASLRQQEQLNQKTLQEKTAQIIQNAQNTLDTLINEIKNKINTQLDTEFEKVRKQLDEYKNHRFAIINQNLMDILEKTLEETIGKKLTLEEHSELIFQALEEAKKENALT